MGNRTPLSLWLILGFSATGILLFCYIFLARAFSVNPSEAEQALLMLPSFYFGPILFASLFLVALRMHKKDLSFKSGIMIITGGAFFGTLFFVYRSFTDIPLLFKYGYKSYFLGVPASVTDLIVTMLICVTAALAWSYYYQHNR